MEKSLLHTMGKNTPRIALVLLLIANITLISIPQVDAASTPTLSVDPPEYTAPAPGHNFTVSINVTNVERLGSFEFYLGYNTTLLEAVSCSLTPIIDEYFSYLIPSPWTPTAGIFHDRSHVYFGSGGLIDMDVPFTGSGALLTITFTALEEGSGTLDLYDTLLTGITPEYDIYTIAHEVDDGSITVVPEFPASILMPLLLILTLAATFLGKIVWSRKRKDISTLK